MKNVLVSLYDKKQDEGIVYDNFDDFIEDLKDVFKKAKELGNVAFKIDMEEFSIDDIK